MEIMDKKLILIIDDEAEIVEQVKEFFEEEGFRVFTAESGEEGVRFLGQEKPALVILDMKLPDMAGTSVLRAVKQKSPKSKVIVITGYVDQAMMDEAEQIGRDLFLQKPFDLEKLREEVEKL
ncbi:MAG: two-component system response regulator, partial [Candidatus Omnitrophica bacterium CG11_big_fil_rev_8_21_14_0_20_45_26]